MLQSLLKWGVRKIQIKQIHDVDSEWDNFINSDLSSEEAFFKLSLWHKIIKNTYAYETFYLQATNGSKIIGVLPLMLVKSKIFGNRLISLPFIGYGCGPVISKDYEQILQAFHQKALGIAKKNKVKFIEIRSPEKNIRAYLEKIGYVTRLNYSRFILDISESEDKIWNSVHKHIRNSIRKAKKSGLKIVSGTIDELYELHLKCMKDLGTPPHKKEFYKNILNMFGSNFKILFAQFKNKKIAAISFFKFKKYIIWFDGLCLSKYKTYNPISYLLWAVIKISKKDNCITFDFGNSRNPSGNFDFKKRWKSKIENSPRYYFFLDKSEIIDPRMEDINRKMETWKKVPILVTRIIGPYLRKQVGV